MPPDAGDLAAPQTPLAAQPSIVLGGTVRADLSDGVKALRIQEDVQGLYGCEVTFGNWGTVGNDFGFLYFDRKTFDFGAAIEVRLGTDRLFAGAITALEGDFPEGAPPLLNVLAEDGLQALRMTRRTRTFTEVTDEMVFRSVASGHGLTPDVQAPGPKHRVLTQLNQSDLAFMRERARAIGAEVWIADKKLSVRPHAARTTATANLGYGRELRSVTVAADLAGQRSDLTVSGWDVAAKAALSARADDATLSGELGGDLSGASILASAFSPRHDTVAHAVPLNNAEAKARSDALFAQAARRFVRGHCVTQTTAGVRVGSRVTIDGLGPLFTGKYYVTHAVHLFDRVGGLRTELTVERPGLGRAS